MQVDITIHIIIILIILAIFFIYSYVDNPIFMAAIIVFAVLGLFISVNSTPILINEINETTTNLQQGKDITITTYNGIDFAFFEYILILFYTFSMLVVVINYSLGRNS